MSEAFREPSPYEVQQAVLQFMGQNLGSLKQLDSSLISKNSTLQGMTLQPGQVMRSIPAPSQPAPPPPPVQHNQPVYQQVSLQPQPQPEVPLRDPNEPMQLEFNFEKTQYGKNILESLKGIENVLEELLTTLQKIDSKIAEPLPTPLDKKKED